jgi:predicted nucleic acid-binding protein
MGRPRSSTTISTAEMRRIFIDTSAWLTLLNRNERHHGAAETFHREVGSGTARLTSWGVLAETYTWLRYHTSFRTAEGWLHEEARLEERGALEVVFPTAGDEAGVRRILSRFADQDLSYVDAFTLHVVQTRGDIDGIFAFDHHLTLAGISVVPGEL